MVGCQIRPWWHRTEGTCDLVNSRSAVGCACPYEHSAARPLSAAPCKGAAAPDNADAGVADTTPPSHVGVSNPVARRLDPLLAVPPRAPLEAPTPHLATGTLRRPDTARGLPTDRCAPPLPSLPGAGLPEAGSGDGEGEEGGGGLGTAARGSPRLPCGETPWGSETRGYRLTKIRCLFHFMYDALFSDLSAYYLDEANKV